MLELELELEYWLWEAQLGLKGTKKLTNIYFIHSSVHQLLYFISLY